MNSLDSALELCVRRLICSFNIVVVALRHYFVLEQKLGAIELVVGTRYFNFGLVVIGSRFGNLVALDEANGLVLFHLHPWPHVQLDQPPGDLGVDMDHARGIGFHPRGELQAIGHCLRVDGRDLDGSFLRCISWSEWALFPGSQGTIAKEE